MVVGYVTTTRRTMEGSNELIYNIDYNILDGSVYAKFTTRETELGERTLSGVLVMPLEAFRGFRADLERGADFDPANRNVVTFRPDSSVRASWPV